MRAISKENKFVCVCLWRMKLQLFEFVRQAVIGLLQFKAETVPRGVKGIVHRKI